MSCHRWWCCRVFFFLTFLDKDFPQQHFELILNQLHYTVVHPSLDPETGLISGQECTLQYCVCIGINIAWSSWHHLSGFLSDITPQHHGNMYADGYWIPTEARPDIQQWLLQFSGRGSERTNTHTCTLTHRDTTKQTYLSQQFLGSFPVCYILSRKTTKLFMKPNIYDSMVGTIQ